MSIHTSDNWHYNINNKYSNTADAYVDWINVFIAAGWTAVQSSDGTTVTPSVLNNAAAWGNSNAWTHLRDPGGASGRDIAIQRGSSTFVQNTAVYLGRAGEPLTGGTGSVVPNSTGRFQLVGTGGAVQSNWMGSSAASNFYFHFAAKAVPGGTSGDVYAFWVIVRSTNSVSSGDQGMVYLIPLTSTADGVVGDADAEPWASTVSNGFSSLRGWYKSGLTGELQDTTLTANELTSWTGINPYTGLDDLSPVYVYSTTGGREQRKGVCEDWYADSAVRGFLQIMSPTVEGASRLNHGSWSIPWPHNVPVLI